MEKTSTLQKVTQETEILRKQVEHFKGLHENLIAENRYVFDLEKYFGI